MEWNSAIHLHIPQVISLWAFVRVKHGGIGQKNSNNQEASDDFHIQFLPSEGRRASNELLNLTRLRCLVLWQTCIRGVFPRKVSRELGFTLFNPFPTSNASLTRRTSTTFPRPPQSPERRSLLCQSGKPSSLSISYSYCFYMKFKQIFFIEFIKKAFTKKRAETNPPLFM